jgi:hypothetical protein
LKTIKVFIFILSVYSVVSCENYLEKPITKELTEIELKKSLSEINPSIVIDSTLYYFSNKMRLVKDSLNKRIDLKTKLSTISYNDYLNYKKVEKYTDSILKYSLKPKHKKEYGYIIKQIDSLYNSYYISVESDNQFESYPFPPNRDIPTDIMVLNELKQMQRMGDSDVIYSDISRDFLDLKYVPFLEFSIPIIDSIKKEKFPKYKLIEELHNIYTEVYFKSIGL